VKEFAGSQLQRARRIIQTASMLVATDPESAASRAYYAAFHALTALFALRGQNFKKHAALRAALHKDLIKSREWPMERGKDYDLLTELRETSDYGEMARVTEQDARRAVEAAKRIIAACQEELSILGS
jgi:uncharacterized protein (UPF0332 family)